MYWMCLLETLSGWGNSGLQIAVYLKKIEVFQEFTKALLKIISVTKKLFYLY